MFANVGYKGGEGGTHLRNVLMSLSGTTDEARAKLGEMGISLYDMDGNMRPVIDVLQDFKSKLNGLTDEQVRASGVILVLISVRTCLSTRLTMIK